MISAIKRSKSPENHHFQDYEVAIARLVCELNFTVSSFQHRSAIIENDTAGTRHKELYRARISQVETGDYFYELGRTHALILFHFTALPLSPH